MGFQQIDRFWVIYFPFLILLFSYIKRVITGSCISAFHAEDFAHTGERLCCQTDGAYFTPCVTTLSGHYKGVLVSSQGLQLRHSFRFKLRYDWKFARFVSYDCLHFRDPIYWHGLTLIPARTSNHMPSKMGDEIAYPFPNFNGCTVGGGGGGLLVCKQIYETCGFVWYIYCAAITHKEPPLSNPGSRILH